MKRIEVDIPLTKGSEDIDVQNQLSWYDDVKKEVMWFTGGNLQMEYVECKYLKKHNYIHTKRWLPKVIPLTKKIETKKKDKSIIEKILRDYEIYHNGKAVLVSKNNDEYVFNIPDAGVADFTHELDRKRIRYNIR